MSRAVVRRTYLQHFGFLSLTTVILWPTPSYYQLLRFATIPTLFMALPYILPTSILISSLYLGVADPPEKWDIPSLLRGEILSSLTIISLSLPYAVLALATSNNSLRLLLPLIGILLPTALFYNALGTVLAATVPLPTLRHIIAWSAAVLILLTTAFYLPPVNPVIAVANATGSAALLSSAVWLPRLTPFPLLLAGAAPLLGAGILTMAVVLWKR